MVRHYENTFPDENELVIVTVKSINELGAYVLLNEYSDIEGMILLSDLSQRRIRSISQSIHVGKQDVAIVIRVDKEKGYIDLSKKRVTTEDIKMCEERYKKNCWVHNMMRKVSKITDTQIETTYTKIIWPLAKQTTEHVIEIFKVIITDETTLNTLDISESLKTALINELQKLKQPSSKLIAKFEITCFSYEGIDAIKEALYLGLSLQTPEASLQIKLVSSPLYAMICTTNISYEGLAIMQKALDLIDECIKGYKGTLKVIEAPKIMTLTEEADTLIKLQESKVKDDESDESDGLDGSDEAST